MKKKRVVGFIDPGISTGFVLTDGGYQKILSLELIEAKDNMEGLKRIKEILYPYQNYHKHLFIERPQNFAGALGRAISYRGDLITLAIRVGCYTAAFDTYTTFKPAEWKGSLSKSLICKRVKTAFPEYKDKSFEEFADLWDALGMLLYVRKQYQMS